MHLSEQEIMIFSNERGYSTAISKKKQDSEEWMRIYFPVSFRKGVTVKNQTKIKIIDSWLSFYERKADSKKVPYIFVNEFDVIE